MKTLFCLLAKTSEPILRSSADSDKTSISIQEKGRQICVYRNCAVRVTDANGKSRSRSTTKYIFAFSKFLDHVPAITSECHKVQDSKARLSEAEHAKVVDWFEWFVEIRSQKFAHMLVGGERSYLAPLADIEVVDPASLDLFPVARLLHEVVDAIDHCELSSERPLAISEIEQVYQALSRLKRRLQYTGVREKDVHYKLFKAFDDRRLLANVALPERGLRCGDSLYRKRAQEEIERGRLMEPIVDAES